MNKIIIAFAGFLVLFGVGRAAHAGVFPSNNAYCSTYSGGGYCYGDLNAFEGSTTYAEFFSGGSTQVSDSFDAYLNNTYYWCDVASSSTNLLNAWPMVETYGAEGGYFYIVWNTSNTCTELEILNSTAWENED